MIIQKEPTNDDKNSDNDGNNDKQQINNKKCKFCGKNFQRSDNCKRHMKVCKVKDSYLENQKLQEKLKEKEKKEAETAEVCKENNILLKGIASERKNSKMMNIATMYPNAEPLKLLSYEDYLRNTNLKFDKKRSYQDFEEQFLEEVLSSHRKKSAHKTVGDAMINVYKTKNPKERSLWCTDLSRLKYMVMKLNTENKAEWTSDPNGKYIQTQIIDPIMNSLKKLLDKYKNGFYIKKHKKNGVKMSKYMDRYIMYVTAAHDLFDKIERKKFQPKLLRYLSQHFSTSKGIAIRNKNG